MGRLRGQTILTGSSLTSRVGQWTQPGLVKSIQRGTITIAGGSTSNTATITAVSLSDTRLVFLGIQDPADTTADINAVRITLTNATTITATVNTVSAGGGRIVSYEVIEYWPGVIQRVQRGTLSTVAAASGTATITSVDTNKTTLETLGFTTTYNATTEVGTVNFSLTLTNATTITGIGLASQTRTAGYQIIEWY